MRNWNHVPLFRLFLPFVAGILIEIFLPLKIEIILPFFLLSILVAALFTFIKKLYRKWKLRWIYGTFVNGVLFFLGVILTHINTDKNISQHFSYATEAKTYIAVLDDELHEKKNTLKTVLNIKSVKLINNQWQNVAGNVLVYFDKDSNAAKLKYGDVVVFSAKPGAVELPKNPEEFNYKRFLSFHNIYQQVYLPGNKWMALSRNEGNPLRKFSFDLRNQLREIFKTKIIREQEYGVASALVLGYTDNIDAELINAYASAGALHVLSVSGMHVGIIFLVFSSLLVWMNRNKWLRHLKFIILLSFIWFYAMLTGFSPAVLRSAMMISVIIIGTWISGNTNVFNTLIVSVFLLLLYNPYLITEVGFQLSYLAVFGIVYLHPMIVKWFEPSNWLVYQIWQITSVSISAQLMTFPLGLLYFHQFPNLFFVSNLVVIPLSTVIIYISILLLFISGIPVLSTYLSITCFGLLYALNNAVLFVERIPYAILKGVSISVFETWIIYLLMASTLFFILYKRPVYLLLSLMLALIFLSGQVMESFSIIKQKKFIVYDVSKESAFDFIDGRKNYFVAQNSLAEDKSKMMFHVIHNWWLLGLEDTKHIIPENCNLKDENIFMKNNYVKFYDKRIAIIKNRMNNYKGDTIYKPMEKLKLDYLILSGNNYQKIKNLLSYFDFKMLIIDSSNSTWRSAKMIKECKELHVNYYSVPQQGAFVIDI